MSRTISEIIANDPLISGTRDMTVRAACQLMWEKRLSGLPIIEKDKFVGIFTERDAMKMLANKVDFDKTKMGDVMITDPVTVRGGLTLGFALIQMVEGDFSHVCVVDDNGKPLGMVTARDAMGRDIVKLEYDMGRIGALSKLRYTNHLPYDGESD